MAGGVGSIVKEIHNNPMDIGSKMVLTQGTVFLSDLYAVLYCTDFKNERQWQNIMQLLILQEINLCF